MKSRSSIQASSTDRRVLRNAQDIRTLTNNVNNLVNKTVTFVTAMPSSPVNNQVVTYIGPTTEEYTHGHLYQYQSKKWVDTSTGTYPVVSVTNISCLSNGTTVSLKWTDPEDFIMNTIPMATWSKTVLVRKTTGYPTSPDDGTVVLTSTTRNQYKDTPYVDTLAANTTNYYRFFTYTTVGLINADDSATVVAGALTWKALKAMCANPYIDMRDVLQAGDVLTAANTARQSDGNGGYEWQVTDVTHDDFGLLSYKIVDRLPIDTGQKDYILTEDTEFHPEYVIAMTIGGSEYKFYINDRTAVGKKRVWVSYGTINCILLWVSDRWEIRKFSNGSMELGGYITYQTTVTEDPWDPAAVWSADYGMTPNKKYYTKSGDTYEEATVTAGDPIPADTYYEYNPGGTGVLELGNSLYPNSWIDQWLNTDADKGGWGVPPTSWHNTPTWVSQYDGFMKGFDEDFLNAVKTVDIKVYVSMFNYAYFGGSSMLKTLRRKFYLPAREDVGITSLSPNYPESTVPELYIGATNDDRIKYKSTDGYSYFWWLRSPSFSTTYVINAVNGSGVDINHGLNMNDGVVPACRIGI